LKRNSTVLDDKGVENLFGDAGRDWFFDFGEGEARDRTSPKDR